MSAWDPQPGGHLRQALLEAVLAAHGKVLDRRARKQGVVVEEPVGAVDDGARGEGGLLARRICRRSVGQYWIVPFIVFQGYLLLKHGAALVCHREVAEAGIERVRVGGALALGDDAPRLGRERDEVVHENLQLGAQIKYLNPLSK